MKKLITEEEYNDLYSRRSTNLSIGDEVDILTGVIGEYRTFSTNSAKVYDIDAENRTYILEVDNTFIAIKFNRDKSQVIHGRVTKYETSLILK